MQQAESPAPDVADLEGGDFSLGGYFFSSADTAGVIILPKISIKAVRT